MEKQSHVPSNSGFKLYSPFLTSAPIQIGVNLAKLAFWVVLARLVGWDGGWNPYPSTFKLWIWGLLSSPDFYTKFQLIRANIGKVSILGSLGRGGWVSRWAEDVFQPLQTRYKICSQFLTSTLNFYKFWNKIGIDSVWGGFRQGGWVGWWMVNPPQPLYTLDLSFAPLVLNYTSFIQNMILVLQWGG